jgi:hypothetical protein
MFLIFFFTFIVNLVARIWLNLPVDHNYFWLPTSQNCATNQNCKKNNIKKKKKKTLELGFVSFLSSVNKAQLLLSSVNKANCSCPVWFGLCSFPVWTQPWIIKEVTEKELLVSNLQLSFLRWSFSFFFFFFFFLKIFFNF